jgi:hypothetical protein
MPLPRLARAIALSCAVLAMLAVTAAAASADPPWSAPTALPGAGTGPAAATTRGHVAAIVTANRAQPPNTASQLLRLDPATGSVLSSAPLDLGGAAITAYATDALAVAGTSIGPSGTIDDQSRVRAGTVSAAGGAPALRTLSGTQGQNVTALVGNARGDVALATRGLRTRLIYLRRKGTSAFSRVLTINVSSTARGVTVAISPSGELLVVWEDRHEVFARHRGARGTWGAAHTLGPGIQSDLQAAMDATGRMLVAWKSQRVNEGESNAPAVVSFITAAAGHGFGSRRTIETVDAARFVGAPGVRLQVSGDDQALLAWTGFDGARFVVRAMPLERGHVGARQQLSPVGVDAVLGDVATASDGRALALWRSGVLGADPAPGVSRSSSATSAPRRLRRSAAPRRSAATRAPSCRPRPPRSTRRPAGRSRCSPTSRPHSRSCPSARRPCHERGRMLRPWPPASTSKRSSTTSPPTPIPSARTARRRAGATGSASASA